MSPSSPLFFYILFFTTSVHSLPSSAQNSLTEGEVSTSPTENGDLITAPERTTSSVSATTKEPLLIYATEEGAALNRMTNEEALSINGTPAQTEKSLPFIESVGSEGRIGNNSSFSNETQTFTNNISAIASSPLSMTVSPSSPSQLEEGRFQAAPPLTKPHHQEKSAVLNKEATKDIFQPPVIAKKCCESSEFGDGTNCVAKTFPSAFDPLTGATKDSESVHYNFTWKKMIPNCPKDSKYQVIRFPGEDVSLGANRTHSYLEWTELYFTSQTTEYCIGQQQDGNYSAVTCMEDEDKVEKENILMFDPRWYHYYNNLKFLLRSSAVIISTVCLAFLILFHLSTKKLRNVEGYCFLSYSLSLLLVYAGFFVQLSLIRRNYKFFCIFNALFRQFTLHAAFFWLSVMCFDIWRVIRSSVKFIPLTGILEKDKQIFLLYASYAFGCPLVIVLVTLIMQSLPPESSAGLIVPGIGVESCWFKDDLAEFVYFHLAIATLIALSLCMLGHVTYMLYHAEAGMACCLRERQGSRAFNRKHLSLFRLRLLIFTLVAICWSTEVIVLKTLSIFYAWVVTDLLNTLQGVIVFIIFLLSKQKRQLVKESLLKKFKKIKKALQETNSSMTEESRVALFQETSKRTTESTEQSQMEIASMPSGTQVSSGGNGNHGLRQAAGNGSPEGCSGGVVSEGYRHEREEKKGVSRADENQEVDSQV